MISVCMATYNGEEYIKEQLESILKQLEDKDELIISDDNSTDTTLKIIENFQDKRIKVFLNKKEKGYTKNFENALEKSNGDIIFLSDQDDVWMDNKVKLCLDALNSFDFVVHDGEMVDGSLNTINCSVFKYRNVKQGFIPNFTQIKYLGCCMVFKKAVLEKSLPFPNNQFYVTHDSWLSLVAEAYFAVQLISVPLIKYRRHGNNTSFGGAKGVNSLVTKVNIRLYSLYQLIKIYFRSNT